MDIIILERERERDCLSLGALLMVSLGLNGDVGREDYYIKDWGRDGKTSPERPGKQKEGKKLGVVVGPLTQSNELDTCLN